MSASGSSAQFGRHLQQSLGPDFDRYADQMQAAGSKKFAENQRGPADDHEISVGVENHSARKVAESGYIHNGFHPDARLYGGMGGTYESNRRIAEKNLFGIPTWEDHNARPVYGYLRNRDSDRVRWRQRPTDYGNVVFDVHPGDRRVTTTPGDSLNNAPRTNFVRKNDPGNPISYNLVPTPVEGTFSENDVEELAQDHNSRDYWVGDGYREVQIHGGSVSKSQIRRASVYEEAFRADRPGYSRGTWETVHNLRSAGIPTRVMGHMEYQPTLDRKMFGDGREGFVDLEAHGSTKYPRPRPR